ncbi:MAG TPA: MFS transporter [Propionibacteriaceae bacterium]|nr:MFS transporter [Propionibacteriaceae bacterium]
MASSDPSIVTEPPEQRRTLVILVLAQVLSGVALAAGVTVGALLAQDMLGSTRLSGLPSALFAAGGAVAAVGVGRLSERSGRRVGLTAGYLVGAVGGFGVVAAAWLDNVVLLFTSLLVYGAGVATSLQARYAGADLAAPSRRGRAVSTVLVATTFGAVVGPNLVTVTGRMAEAIGIPVLAGPFLLAGVAYSAAGLLLWAMLRPDPLQLARALASLPSRKKDDAHSPARPTATGPDLTSGQRRSASSPAVVGGAGILVLTQFVMVAIMTMTPIHIQHYGHDLSAIGVVIGAHIAAMFLPSPLSGWLVDRFGPRAIATTSAVTLLVAGLLAASAPSASVITLGLALVLLGLGWNFGLVSGSTVITDAVPLAFRARTQGTVDLAVAVAGACGGVGSGLLVSTTSYGTLALLGGLVALAVIPFAVLGRPRSVQEAEPSRL